MEGREARRLEGYKVRKRGGRSAGSLEVVNPPVFWRL